MALGSKNHHYQHQLAPYTKPSYHNHDHSSDHDFQLEDSLDEQPMLIGGASVVRRNARERNRVKQVNNGFSQLRQHIPVAIIADLSNGRRGIGPGANKKLSKVSTLRMAVEYIRRLQRLIDDNDQKHQQQQQQHSQQPQSQQRFWLDPVVERSKRDIDTDRRRSVQVGSSWDRVSQCLALSVVAFPT